MPHSRNAIKDPFIPPDEEPRMLFYDIEATNLNASFGVVLCIGYKWLGDDKVYCPTILDKSPRDMLDDKKLIQDFFEGPMQEASSIVGWYSLRYDLPMLRTRALKHKIKPPPPVHHIDLWRFSRYKLKMHSNRLAAVQEFLKTPHAKNAIDHEAWQYAAMGRPSAMKKVVKHCKYDVLVLEDVFKRLRPWLDQEPPHPAALLAARDDIRCVSCGSDRVHSNGWKMTLAGAYRRYQCQKCGKYTRGKAALARPELRQTI